MKLKQISVFLENRPGSLTGPCRLLAQAGINIITFSLADTQQFGILRLIVRDPLRAQTVLDQGGCVTKLTEVVALEVPDRPGGLEHVLDVVQRRGINVEYVYAFTMQARGHGVLVFRFDAPDQAVAALTTEGVRVVDEAELEKRLAG